MCVCAQPVGSCSPKTVTWAAAVERGLLSRPEQRVSKDELLPASWRSGLAPGCPGIGRGEGRGQGRSWVLGSVRERGGGGGTTAVWGGVGGALI